MKLNNETLTTSFSDPRDLERSTMNDFDTCPACGLALNCSGCGEPIENIIAQSSLAAELDALEKSKLEALAVVAKERDALAEDLNRRLIEIAALKTRVAKMNNCFYHWNKSWPNNCRWNICIISRHIVNRKLSFYFPFTTLIFNSNFVQKIFVASTHSYLLIFTDKGRMFWLKVYEIPLASRTAKGRPLVNLVRLAPDERVCGILPVRNFEEGRFVVMVTEKGIIKKTDLMQFSNPRASGIIAIHFDGGDRLIGASLSNGKDEILISTKDGMSIRFAEDDVRPMGRAARGVRGIDLEERDKVVGLDLIDPKAQLLTVSEFGYGKRTDAEEYRSQSRGGKGIITIKTTDRNGAVVAALQVCEADEVMIVTSGGKLIRIKVKEISVIGRNTQGMRLIALDEGERVTSVTRVVSDEDEVATEGKA